MRVTVRSTKDGRTEIGQATLHSEFRHFSSRLASRYYDVAADGRLLVIFRTGSETPEQSRQINIVVNWFDELLRLVPLPSQ